MVAIVAGNSLGLSLTSIATLGQAGQSGAAGAGRNGQQVFVNAVNGNLVVQGSDDAFAARGADLTALRTYNTNDYRMVPTVYDAAGNLQQYKIIDDGGGGTNTYTTSFAYFDGYKELGVSGTSTRLRPGNTASTYDVNGLLVAVEFTHIQDHRIRVRVSIHR